MKTIYSIFLITLISFPYSTQAKLSKYIGIGATRATLRSEGGKSDWGNYIGLGLEYSRPYSLLFAIEGAYTTKIVTLEEKSWPSSNEPEHSGMSIGDVPIDGAFFELATKIGYYIPLVRNLTAIKLFAGPAISLQHKHLSLFRASTRLDYDEEKGQYEFDYLRCESGRLPIMAIDSILGVIFSYKNFGIEFRYARSLSERKCFRGLTIKDKLDYSCISLFYGF